MTFRRFRVYEARLPENRLAQKWYTLVHLSQQASINSNSTRPWLFSASANAFVIVIPPNTCFLCGRLWVGGLTDERVLG